MRKICKKIVSMLISATLLLSVCTAVPFTVEAASSCTYTSNDLFEYTVEINEIDDGTTWIHGYIGTDTDVVIPSEIEGRKVVGIMAFAFSDCPNVTNIEMPSDVNKFEKYAFEDTAWYKNIYNTHSDGVIYINNVAVDYKGEMPENTHLTLKDGTTGIAGGAFWGSNGSLVEIEIPDSVTYIGEDAFNNCYNLKSVNIPDGVTEISDGAFCNASLTSITIPDSVERLGNHAFSDCYELNNVILGKGLNKINESTFSTCMNLESIVIPDNIISIDDCAFWGCYNLENITMSDNLLLLDSDVFLNTKWFENQSDGVVYIGDFVYGYKGEMPESTYIELREGVRGIAGSAFEDCTNLSGIRIPESVLSFGEDAFNNCTNLTIYGYENSKAEVFANQNEIDFVSIGSYEKDFEFKYKHLKDNTVEITECIGTSTDFKIPIEIEGCKVSSIGDYAFIGCPNLETVRIPYSVEKIGYNSFCDCDSMTDIYYNGSYDDWNKINSATRFYGVSTHFGSNKNADETNRCGDFEYNKLTDTTVEITGYIGFDSDIVIPSNLDGYKVTSIGCCLSYSFKENLKSVVISEGITTIGESAFEFSLLESVKLPSTLKNIGYMSFWACENLTEINIPEGVERIEDGAFGCTNIKSFYIPASVTYCDAPFDFNVLNEVVVDEDNQNYYSKDGVLFRKSDNELLLYPRANERTVYVIPDGTSKINRIAFLRGTGNLKELIIPGSVNVLDSGTLFNANLDKLILCEGVETIKQNAFLNCNFTNITIPKSVTSIEEKSIGYTYMDGLNPEPIEGFTIYGYKGTTAESYAIENGFAFESLDTMLVGDVNGDGVISVLDASDVQKYLVNLINFTDAQKSNADVNGDGAVTIMDSTHIQKYLVGLAEI